MDSCGNLCTFSQLLHSFRCKAGNCRTTYVICGLYWKWCWHFFDGDDRLSTAGCLCQELQKLVQNALTPIQDPRFLSLENWEHNPVFRQRPLAWLVKRSAKTAEFGLRDKMKRVVVCWLCISNHFPACTNTASGVRWFTQFDAEVNLQLSPWDAQASLPTFHTNNHLANVWTFSAKKWASFNNCPLAGISPGPDTHQCHSVLYDTAVQENEGSAVHLMPSRGMGLLGPGVKRSRVPYHHPE